MIVTGIPISDSASDMERLAASVLQDYCQRMSGNDVPILSTDDSQAGVDGAVLIGLQSTNPHINSLIRSRKIRNPERRLKPEGFVIETLIDGGLSGLVITGRDPKGILNGVYYLLEEIFGVGFFRDGQRVPIHENLTVPELCIATSPKSNTRE